MRSPLLGSGVATAVLLAALLLVRTADAGGLSVSGAGCERVGGQVDKILCVVNTVRASAGLRPDWSPVSKGVPAAVSWTVRATSSTRCS